MMKIPCEKCISLAMCVSQKIIVCPDLFKFACFLISEKDEKKADKEGKRTKLLLPNMEALRIIATILES